MSQIYCKIKLSNYEQRNGLFLPILPNEPLSVCNEISLTWIISNYLCQTVIAVTTMQHLKCRGAAAQIFEGVSSVQKLFSSSLISLLH